MIILKLEIFWRHGLKVEDLIHVFCGAYGVDCRGHSDLIHRPPPNCCRTNAVNISDFLPAPFIGAVAIDPCPFSF